MATVGACRWRGWQQPPPALHEVSNRCQTRDLGSTSITSRNLIIALWGKNHRHVHFSEGETGYPCGVHCSKLWLQEENNFKGWIHVNIPGLWLMVWGLGLGGKTRRLHEGGWGESKSSVGAEGQGWGGLHTWLWGQMCMDHYVCTKMEINKNSFFLRSPSFLQCMFETFQLWFLENNNLTCNLAHWIED